VPEAGRSDDEHIGASHRLADITGDERELGEPLADLATDLDATVGADRRQVARERRQLGERDRIALQRDIGRERVGRMAGSKNREAWTIPQHLFRSSYPTRSAAPFTPPPLPARIDGRRPDDRRLAPRASATAADRYPSLSGSGPRSGSRAADRSAARHRR
jgi:hypothetical protein